MFKMKATLIDDFFKKCSFLFNSDAIIKKEDYEWLGWCHMNFLQKISLDNKKKYRDMLERACENSATEAENYGILIALKMHFYSLCLLPTEWHK